MGLCYNRRPLSIVILACSLLSACGASDKPGSDPTPQIISIEPEHHQPAAYHLADPTCQQEKGQDLVLESAWLYRWSASDVVLEKRGLSGLKMNPATLESSAIKRTTFGDTFERTCDASRGNAEACLKPNGMEKGYSPVDTNYLRYCETETKFARDTYEGVGLHAAEYLTRAAAAWDAHGPAIGIEKVHLSVLPNFVTYYDNYETVTPAEEPGKVRMKTTMTHNAMYLPSIDMIAVLPARKDRTDEMTGFFWESPFVLAHEFGHHIEFEMRGQNQIPNLALQWNPLSHSYVDQDPERLLGSGTSAKALVAGSFSEAFADLLAYYSAEGAADSLIGLPCFGQGRDIGRSTFGDETPKLLSTAYVSMLLSGDHPEVGCGQPDFSDIHVHGAILAHTLNRSFAQLTEAAAIEAGSTADYGERYKLAVSWMVAATVDLGTLVTDGKDPSTLFQAAASGLEKAARDWLPGFSLAPDVNAVDVEVSICEAVAADWPAVEIPSFAAAQGCQP